MVTQFFSIGLIALLGAMTPGPDFAIVTKNTLLHSRKAGLYTTLGVGTALLIHMSYCVFGLAVVIFSSMVLFNVIKFVGAAYLIYLGVTALFSKQSKPIFSSQPNTKTTQIRNFTAFRQGFLCNLLNPKATLFFLSLFTVMIPPETPFLGMMIYAGEIIFFSTGWFSTLVMILSHARVKVLLDKAEKFIEKTLGVFLIGFGVVLAFVRK